MPRLLLDAMGGDHAPQAILDGALLASKDLRFPLTLIGDENAIRSHAIARQDSERIEIIHAPEVIGMEDKIKTIRSKQNAPINVGMRLIKESWKRYESSGAAPSAFVSAGHSGAMMASALLTLGRMDGVDRPAIAAKMPTLDGKGVICLDVGANVDCKPEHLRDFAVMGALFAQSLGISSNAGRDLPKIGLLSNGEERSKGNELTRAALELLDQEANFAGPNAIGTFVGYTEAKEMFKGDVDVVVMDGFIGNLILKNSEALASSLIQLMREEAVKSPLYTLGFALARGALRAFKRKVDFRETGAAPLLGVKGYVFISHGRSDAVAIRNALLRAQESLEAKMAERLQAALAPKPPKGEEA